MDSSELTLPANIIDSEYFTNYEDLSVHELMLRDKPRQDAYRDAILNHKYLFKGKTVLDVGTGTGILSIFCAQAGAAKVFAVEASNLAEIAKKVVIENGFEKVIEVHQCRIEDFKLPEAVEKVDILISEWMGFYLLHEGMLDSVIFARDKFLKEDGIMIPETATIYFAPISIPNRFSDWENVSGVKMTSFAKELRHQKSQSPEIMVINSDQLLSRGESISWLDLKEVTNDDLKSINYKDYLVIEKSGKYEGLCLWFDCSMGPLESAMLLSTSPTEPATHWKQTVIVFPESNCQNVEVGEPIALSIDIERNELNARRYNLQVNMLDPNEMEHIVPCDCYLTKCILGKQYFMTTEKPDDLMTEE